MMQGLELYSCLMGGCVKSNAAILAARHKNASRDAGVTNSHRNAAILAALGRKARTGVTEIFQRIKNGEKS
jgi:hypothetical protein